MPSKSTTMVELKAAVRDVQHLTPKQIANTLKKSKILGRPGTTGRCPLALLLHAAYGGQFVVGQKYILHRVGKSTVERIPTPPNLAAFVRMFDAGEFPELIQVPPRCLPRPNGKAHSPADTKVGGHNRHARKRGADRLQLARLVGR